jgi:hypothetical protein
LSGDRLRGGGHASTDSGFLFKDFALIGLAVMGQVMASTIILF